MIDLKQCSLGIELGSTRIKAVLVGDTCKPVAQGDFTCIGEFDFVDFTVDSPFHRQESLFPTYRGNRGRHRCGRVAQIGVERRGRKFLDDRDGRRNRSGVEAVLQAGRRNCLQGCRFLGSEHGNRCDGYQYGKNQSFHRISAL